jgi:glycosyltransferase involved in cell wall biosynthesis
LLSRMLRPGVIGAFRALLNSRNSKTILQNPDDIETWVKRGAMRRDRIVLIRGAGVNTTEFAPTAPLVRHPGDDRVLVVLTARLLFDKGISEFVQAARNLKTEGNTARFALVGEGDYGNPASVSREDVEGWVREGVVESFGWRTDMAAVLQGADVSCLPSYGEGLPKALLEAASCGLGIVSTDVPGCREVVTHERTGLLVPPRDAGPLTAALRRITTDAALRAQLGSAARARVLAEFSAETVAAQTLAVYTELLASAGR